MRIMSMKDRSTEIEYRSSKAVGGGNEIPVSEEVKDKRREERRRRFEEAKRREKRRLRAQLEYNVKKQKRDNAQYRLTERIALGTGIGVCAALLCTILVFMVNANTSAEEIYTKQTIYEELKTQNDNREDAINSSIDVEEIYRIATEELGMTYPQKHQVVIYDKTESEYVTQYENIPK